MAIVSLALYCFLFSSNSWYFSVQLRSRRFTRRRQRRSARATPIRRNVRSLRISIGKILGALRFHRTGGKRNDQRPIFGVHRAGVLRRLNQNYL